MKRINLLGRVVVVLIASSLAAIAAAEHPDIIHSFRLIPRHSTLEQTGGFAGVQLDYTLFGKFDIITGYEDGVSCTAIGCPPPPTHIPFARFEDVRVFAFNNHPAVDAFPVPLDRFVDLEELRGTFRPDEPRRLLFKGLDQQDQPFELLAVQRGRLLHMLGESREGCCDFFHYKIDALAHIAPYADFNLDGVVDRVDVDRLLANIGLNSDATLEQGDADADGDVDSDDLLIWQQQVGMSISLSEFAADSLADFKASTAAVPEPTSLALLLSGVLLSSIRRQRGNRRTDVPIV
jgi:hypothetical protein